MKRNCDVALSILLIWVATPSVFAARNRNPEIVQGTVVAVQKSRVQSPEYTMGGSNPSDAPLTSRYYTFEVSIRVGCETYVGRYETPLNYLPSAFTADRPVTMRLTKHVMYFDLANDPDLRMGIIRRKSTCNTDR